MKTRFLCETCGSEVASDANVCPYCGTNFVAVKCPMCNFEGKISLFYDGCPQCHYHGEKLSRLINNSLAKDSGSISGAGSGRPDSTARKKRGKAGKITFTDRFYLICSLMLALITVSLLLLLWFKR